MEAKQKTNLQKTLDKLEGLMEKLSGHKFISSVLGIGILLILAETLLPNSSSRIITSLVGLTTAIIHRTATEIGNIGTSVIDLGNTIRDYANRNRPKWLFFFFLYIAVTNISLFIGYSLENNWLFGAGTILLISPIIALGYIQKKIGNIFKGKSPDNSWIKNGNDKITIAVLIGLFALEFMLLHTIWFIIATVLFMAVAFTGAFFFKKSPQPLESLKKLAYLYTGVTFLFVFIALMAEHNATAKSVMERVSSFNYLKIVERNDQTEITNNIAKETEKSPWRLTTIATEMRYGAYDGIDVKKEYKVRSIIPPGQPVRVIKDFTFTDKFQRLWVHVEYNGLEGWAENSFLTENISNDEALELLGKK